MAATALDILRARARNEREAWNEEAAAAFFAAASERLNRAYEDGAFAWAERERPDLMAACDSAEDRVNAAWRAKDRDAFRRTVPAFERACVALLEAYRAERLRRMPSDARTRAGEG